MNTESVWIPEKERVILPFDFVVSFIDPGPSESAYTFWDGTMIQDSGILPNAQIFEKIGEISWYQYHRVEVKFYIEEFMPQGRKVLPFMVGKTMQTADKNCFDTVWWAGQFYREAERFQLNPVRISRKVIKKHFKVASRKKGSFDTQIRQKLIARFGEKPTQKNPNKVYNGFKIKADEWQSWAGAVCMMDKIRESELELF